MTKVTQADWDAAANFIRSDACSLSMKMLLKPSHLADAFATHAHQSYHQGVADERERAARVADYGAERATRDWRDPVKQEAVRAVSLEIAEAIRKGDTA